MEVVGGIASFIAIGQALGAIPKIITAVKSVTNARDELQDLLLELTFLVERYNHAKENLRLSSPQNPPIVLGQEEPYYMKILRIQLERLLEQLHVLARDCQVLADDPTPHKSFRTKWPWKRHKVIGLCEEVKRIQGHLDAATRLFMDRTIHSQSKILIEIHALITKDQLLPGKNEGDTVVDVDCRVPEEQDIASTSSGLTQLTPPSQYCSPPFQRDGRQYIRPCTCNCHLPGSVNKRSINFSLIPGRLSVSYSEIARWMFPCRRCSCGPPRAVVRMDYQFPSWLLNRAIHFKASLDGLSGIATSLRLPAVLSMTDRIWQVLRSPVVEDVQWFIASHGYTPTDADPQGGSIMEYAMTHNEYSNILFLVNRYPHILKDTSAASNAVMQARTKLYEGRDKMLGLEVYTFNRVIELLDENVETSPFTLHEAIRSHGNLDSDMETHASTTNDLDETGFTPLHLACLYDNFDALTYLLLRQADVHATDLQGDTPLHLAASRGQVQFATCLLDAGSDINQRSRYGQTALDKALRSRNITADGSIIELLLMRGASISNVDVHGSSSFHHLAGFKSGPRAAEKSFELLMKAGGKSMLEARNQFDNTPLLDALWETNAPVVRLYLAAGARCDVLNIRDLNILHAIARNGNIELMNILRAAQLSDPDIRASAHNGLTPIGQLRHCIHAIGDRTNIVKDRKPSPNEITTFEVLVREIRDRAIMAEIARLDDIVRDIQNSSNINDNSNEDMAVASEKACEALREVAERKTYWGLEHEAMTFKVIAVQVSQGLWEPAVESLLEFMAVSRERMGVSPFDEE